jgi:DedD protein
MGLLSIFKRRADTPAAGSAASDTADAVQQARVRARQRLIGAAVLVVIGIVGFPLVFETQPRPIPVDIPIEVPRKEGASALVMPPKAPPTHAAASAPSAAPVATASNDVITESREDAGRSVAPAVPVSKPVEIPPEPKAEAKPEVKPESKPPAALEPKPAVKPEPKPATTPAADGAKARALLEGKTADAAPTAAESGRFVVQVGAFADVAAARETRVKVEKLGLKTYTQVASTPAGNRIRVRVGPFGTRDEAAKAQAKAKGAGLSAVVLTL